MHTPLQWLEGEMGPEANKLELLNQQNILIDGIKAIKGQRKYQDNALEYGEGNILLTANGQSYSIGHTPYDSILTKTFDGILSTFKFTK